MAIHWPPNMTQSIWLPAVLGWHVWQTTRSGYSDAHCWLGVPDDIRDHCCRFGNRSCFTSEFTFERCCQGAQAQVQSKPKPTDGPPCFHDEFSFTRCCASTGDLKVFLGDGGCFEPRGKYTYLKCCFELPDLEEWIHVNKVKGSPTSDHFQIFGTLYMTEPVKQRFRQRGIAMPPATLGGVSHADVQSPCLKSVLYDSTNFRYQLIPMWSGNEIFPPPPKEVTMLIKFPTRMKEAVACWSDAQCQLYMVKLDWYSVERHFFEGAYASRLERRWVGLHSFSEQPGNYNPRWHKHRSITDLTP